MRIRRDRIYYFSKSGNRVRAVAPTSFGGPGNWVVIRVDGDSTGKEMIVPRKALLLTLS